MKQVGDLAGESPAGADYSVGAVVISGGGAGDQAVESPEVKVLEGWVQIRSAPTGGLAKQQVVTQVNRSEATKIPPHQNRSVRIFGNAETLKPPVDAEAQHKTPCVFPSPSSRTQL